MPQRRTSDVKASTCSATTGVTDSETVTLGSRILSRFAGKLSGAQLFRVAVGVVYTDRLALIHSLTNIHCPQIVYLLCIKAKVREGKASSQAEYELGVDLIMPHDRSGFRRTWL
jgi:hypothetical protein